MYSEGDSELNNRFENILVDMLKEGLEVTLSTKGNSMLPLWKDKRDSVILSSCHKDSLKKYDVVLFKGLNGKIILHRIVKVNKDSFTMCGDANTVLEVGIPKENVLAVVRAFTRKNKSFQSTNAFYVLYSFIWVNLYPLRYLFLRSYRRFRGVIWRRIQH